MSTNDAIRGFYRVEDVLDDPDDWCGGTHPQLKVWVEDLDGEEVAAEFADEPSDWDGTSPDEYERLEAELCDRLGIDWRKVEWDLK